MNVVIKKPRGGKTTELIKLSSQSHAYIVCMNTQESARIQRQAQEMNLKIPFPITFDEFLQGKFYKAGVKGFLIDNVELLLQSIGRGVPVLACSLSSENILQES